MKGNKVGRPRLVKKDGTKQMANGNGVTQDTIDHWSGTVVPFEYQERAEVFPGVEDAYNALVDQAATRATEKEPADSLVLRDMLQTYNSYVRSAARKAALTAHMATLGIPDDSEDLFKSLVSTIRTKLDAKDPGNSDNLKTARIKALEKVRALNLSDV